MVLVLAVLLLKEHRSKGDKREYKHKDEIRNEGNKTLAHRRCRILRQVRYKMVELIRHAFGHTVDHAIEHLIQSDEDRHLNEHREAASKRIELGLRIKALHLLALANRIVGELRLNFLKQRLNLLHSEVCSRRLVNERSNDDAEDNGDDDNRHTPVAHAIVEELDDIEDPVLNDFPHSIPFYIPKGTLRNRIVSVRSSRTALQDALRSEGKSLFEAVATKRNQSVLRTCRRESAAGREQRRDGSTIELNKEKSQLDRQPLQRTARIDHG